MKERPNPFLPKEETETGREVNARLLRAIFEDIDRIVDETDYADFDFTFVDSLRDQFDRKGRLSAKQYEAILNVREMLERREERRYR